MRTRFINWRASPWIIKLGADARVVCHFLISKVGIRELKLGRESGWADAAREEIIRHAANLNYATP